MKITKKELLTEREEYISELTNYLFAYEELMIAVGIEKERKSPKPQIPKKETFIALPSNTKLIK